MKDKELIELWENATAYIQENETDGKPWGIHLAGGVTKATLDLIKRLKTQSNGYRNKAQAQKGELARLYKQVAEQKAEIERLQAVVDAELDTIHKLGDDYERLQEEEKEFVKTAKAEAIKELEDKFKKGADISVKYIYHYPPVGLFNCNNRTLTQYYTITAEKLENIIKEMVGDAE